MQSKSAMIHWTEATSDTFMYGSRLRFHNNEMLFENPLMPSGEVIHRWHTMMYYPSNKAIPQLPLLKQGQSYRFQLDYTVEPEGAVYFKVIFKKRNGTEADVVTIEDTVATITYPTNAFSYEIHMINAAATRVIFRSIRITALQQQNDGEEGLYISEMRHTNDDTDVVNVVLVAPEGLSRASIEDLHNVIVIKRWQTADIVTIVDCLQPLERGYDLNFIGYTMASNEMAMTLAELMEQTAWVTRDMKHNEYTHTKVEVYSDETTQTTELSLVAPLLHPSRHLKALDADRLNGGATVCNNV